MLDEDNEDNSGVFTPKKSNLSRIAMSKNAARKSLANTDTLPLRRDDDQRPSYSADYLNELKISTPSAPKELSLSTTAEGDIRTLDLASKFGSDLALRTEDGIIPTSAEIAEKKARRKRLAQGNEYVSLHPENSDEEDNEISLEPKAKYAETRLVADDEDIAEGFDDFVTDGRVALGKKAEREQRRKRKEEMRTMIAEAEGGDSGSEDSEDDSEVERRRAYEVTQTRKGMEGLHRTEEEEELEQRPRTPPKITPLPTLGGVLERLKERFVLLQKQKESRVRLLEQVRKQKEGIEEDQERVQRELRVSGEAFEKLRVEAGIPDSVMGANGERLINGVGTPERGLESLGMPLRAEGFSP